MKFKIVTFGLLATFLTLSKADEVNCNYIQTLDPGKTCYVRSNPNSIQYNGRNHYKWEIRSCGTIEVKCIFRSSSNNCGQEKLSIKFSGKNESFPCSDFTDKGKNPIIKFDSSFYTKGGIFMCQISSICHCGWKNADRIVGGQETGVNEYPMMAGLVYYTTKEVSCGATIISEWHVLTAAHCVINRDHNTIGVIVGEHDVTTGEDTSATKLYRMKKYIIHPEYDGSRYDIAICYTKTMIVYSQQVGPVCLPFQHAGNFFINSNVTLLGWGLLDYGDTKPNVLQKVDVKVIINPDCVKNNACNIITYTNSTGKDSCQMDSGGPNLWQDPVTNNLLLSAIIIGGSGCGDGIPSKNTRVGACMDWIMKNTPGICYCMKE